MITRALRAPAAARPRARPIVVAVALAALPLCAPAQPVLPDRGPALKFVPVAREAAPTAPSEEQRVEVLAEEIRGVPDVGVQATGRVDLRRGPVRIEADRLRYDESTGRVRADGGVRARRDGNYFGGSEFELDLNSYQGHLLGPTYFFELTGGGGRAERLDFLGRQQLQATEATYTTCPSDGSGDPDWLLSASSVRLDFAANEGLAEGAVLDFMGVPILALPVLTFPLTSARKSGWLPPSINIDSKSGVDVAVPYYWNIAPDLDATFAPRLMTRRGIGAETEFRYLLENHRGIVDVDLLPEDRVYGEQRFSVGLHHDGRLPGEIAYSVLWLRVSDDDYWKDFPRSNTSPTPRLLPTDLRVERRFGDWTGYLRAQRWQVLQDPDPGEEIIPPYQREPQAGLRGASSLALGLQFEAEAEYNRFVLPSGTAPLLRPNGERVHTLLALSRPWLTPGFRLVPKFSLNAASYRTDPLTPLAPADAAGWTGRSIPTASVDAIWVLERQVQWLGRDTLQTLEPRLLYALTPYRDQSGLPVYDSAPRNFNFESLFSENAFIGVDRVSDGEQITGGVTSRVVDSTSGAELLRLGIAQRLRLRDQRTTLEGPPLSERVSDLLLAGSTTLVPRWTFDAALQYSPERDRAERALLGTRYSPGPFRTVNATYRFTRGRTEQVELGWQWPLVGPGPEAMPRMMRSPDDPRPASGDCRGTWYGVGRVDYSVRDSRLTDSILGVEFDSGCWIARVVGERLSTGRSEATTRLLLQLELVGLSRLGSNPLQVLKDNVPGYRLLGERAPREATTVPDGARALP